MNDPTLLLSSVVLATDVSARCDRARDRAAHAAEVTERDPLSDSRRLTRR